jgi:predicted small secreted protein
MSPRPRRSLLRLATLIAVLGGALATSACNTVEGMGKDTQKAGQAIQRSAE